MPRAVLAMLLVVGNEALLPPRRSRSLALIAMLVCLVSAGVCSVALAQEAPAAQEEPEPSLLTRRLVEEANESPTVELAQPEVDTKAARELPHTGLGPSEALHLLTAVFGEAVETPAGIFDEIPPGKFIDAHAEVMTPESLGELAEEDGSGARAKEPSGPALIESSLPLRVPNESGVQQPVALSLEHAEGELQEENPIVPVGIPTELGEGIELADGEIGISFPGAASGREPTTVEGNSAFYANVQEDTDLIVAPMPTGVETLTQIRSADAPRTEVESLSLPAGATLQSSEDGGAEVELNGRQLVEVTPASAVDAAGEPVPATLSVSGDQLRITVEPAGGTEYPILVDPNFRLDEFNWTWGGSTFAGWHGVISAPGYWALEHAGTIPALELSSGYPGGATPNTGAQWLYMVPRYYSDQTNYGSYPSSWIEYVSLGGMMYLDDPYLTYYPEIVAGVIDPFAGSWVSSPQTWNGTQGEFAGWSGYMAFGGAGNHNAKEFAFGLITLENEAQARLREALAATAVVELRDEDTPSFLELALTSPPTGWVNTGEYGLSYAAADPGLGVEGFKVEVEGQPTTSHTFALGCSGTNQAPCPRVAKSTEAGRPAVKLNAAEAPTGRDWFQVSVYDPLYGYESGGSDLAPHSSPAAKVELKVDHTPPAVSLSGPLTEQETLGTLQSEYPLNISVTDGEDGAPQSGVVSVEVKVDGKKVTMPNESLWKPACSTQNCSFSGAWTLKASEYAPGNHEVEVIATDAVGLVSTTVQEVELGQEPLQTSFTSPHPTYEAHEIPTIAFKATREGAPVEGATFRCSLDGTGETPTTPCSSPFEVPANLAPGKWHTLLVAAVDKSGKADPTPAKWHFETGSYPPAPSSEKLVYPETGKTTASYYTLEAEWGANPEGKAGEGVTGITFEMKLPKQGTAEPVFEPVPAECTIDGHGRQVSWPLRPRSHPGHNPPVYLRVRGCPVFEKAGYPEKEIQFRAVFDGSEKVAGASEPATTEFVYVRNATRVPTDATEVVGPASLDLLTGAFTVSRTDVSIPVPGYESNLEFTRTYKSTEDGLLPGYSKAMGGLWQPSSPLESEYEGEAWTRVEEKIIPPKPAVYGYACWTEQEVPVGQEEFEVQYPEVACPPSVEANCPPEWCEKWLEEPAQPEVRWIELFDNEGSGIPFEIAGGNYIAPEYARELKLTKQGSNFVLGYPNGTHTIFRQDGEHDWLPREISYQSSPSTMRMAYETEPGGKSLRLKREIAPSAVACPDEPEETAGCRSLLFEYGTPTGGAPLLTKIRYYGPSGTKAASRVVAEYTYAARSGIEGHTESVLIGETDPRLPSIWETYSYSGSPLNLLTSIAPHGQEAWNFGYEFGSSTKPSRLKTVSRGGISTTIAYGVPVSGTGAPYNMSAETIAKWGQTDLPVDATAIFPPTHVPSEYPPHEYSGATVHYMDPGGRPVNTASPGPPGVEGVSITTTENDVHGNVVRELSAQNRLNALKAASPEARSHELDTHSIYNARGTEMLESWGPLHEVRLESGETVEARQHMTIHYDEGEPTPPAGTPPAYLPTKETVAAVVPGKEGEFEPRVTETHYNWSLRKPTETVVDPGGLGIRSVTTYNAAGQVEETRQPKGAAGGTAGDTRTIYYSATGEGSCVSKQYANLPCQVLPAAQVEGTGRPKLLVKKFLSYDNLDEPTEVVESPDGKEEVGKTRTTIIKYDEAGRQLTQQIKGGGAEVPKTETAYNAYTGLPERQQFVCESQCGPAGSFQSALAGTGANQFNHPADVAFDSKGNIWVLDKGNNRIEEFNEAGEFQRAAGGEGSTGGKLKAPSALAVDPSNNVWVADTANNRIEEWNEKGEFVAVLGKDVNKTKVEAAGSEAERNYCSAASGNLCQAGPEGTAPGQLKAPQGIAATSSGSLWVADTGHSRMEKFTPTGGLLNNSFGEGSALGQVKAPTAVAMSPEGSLWVADTGNNRIEHWNSSLTSPVAFGTEGTENGKFKHPDALEVANGKVWVGDEGNSRVEEFTETGGYLGKFGAAGAGAGQFAFSSPIGLAADAKGNILITDPGHNKVQRWAPTEATDTQATTVHYNAFGQTTKYEDADGNIAETTYDSYGRPVTTKDNKGSQTVTYDPVSGVVTKLEDSAAGTFTATYNADGSLLERGLPDGLTAKTTYNAAGEPTKLTYTKTTYCGESCTWLEETLQRSISGQIVTDNGTLVNDAYSYDKAGRLKEARETPANGSCTTIAYTYDADSNRLSKATRAPGIGGVCVTSGGNEQKYNYDEADRLINPTYDAWGRITTLPAEFAGGKALETTYYSTNMVATQTQNGVTNSYELDAAGRQRARLQGGGGVEGTEIFHYDGSSDSPAWTERGSTWSRNISGIGGGNWRPFRKMAPALPSS